MIQTPFTRASAARVVTVAARRGHFSRTLRANLARPIILRRAFAARDTRR